MEISDQTLIAYLDGELPEAERAALDKALAADAGLAARLQGHRVLAEQVRTAFGGIVEEPVPERLVSAASGPVSVASSNVVAFPARKPAPRTWLWGGGAAVAASLALGVIVGHAVLPAQGSPIVGPDVVAQGALGVALDHQLAANQAGARVKIGISFRAKDGPLCRTFQTPSQAGLACRQGDSWKVRMAVPAASSANEGGYATAASSMPQEVMALAGSTIAGRPLDADAEAQAKGRGWK